jgi:hypothetical protein
VDRGRRMGVQYAVAIATGGTGAYDLHHGPQPVRATWSASMAVRVIVGAAAKRDLPDLGGSGPVRAFSTADMGSQVDGKPVVTSRLSEGERVVVNGQYTLSTGV